MIQLRSLWCAAALAAGGGFAAPASAQSDGALFQVPEGCTAYLTVQSRSCTVSHHWTCAADPEGTRWRVTMDTDGPFYMSFTDAEFRWLRAWNLRIDRASTLMEPEEDPASLTELLETGRDSMVFTLRYEPGLGAPIRTYTGFDSLTGGQVTVDGETLLVTDFAYEHTAPGGQRRTSGNQFVHPGWRLFFGGIETVTEPDGTKSEGNFSPMAFAEPGEPGFLSTTPLYDCGSIMSSIPAPVWRVRQ